MPALFRPQVAAYQKRRLQGQINLTRPPQLSWLSGLLFGMVAVAVFYLVTAQYTRKETVHGVLQPVQGQVRILAEQQAEVEQVFVKEGQIVTIGAPLVQLSKRKINSDQTDLSASMRAEVQQMLANQQQQLLQLSSKHQLELTEATNSLTNAKQQQSDIAEQIKTLAQRIWLNQQQLKKLQSLSGSGYISGLEITKQKDALLALHQQEKTLQADVTALSAKTTQLASALEQLPLTQQAEQKALENTISGLKNQLSQLEQQQNSLLTASISGKAGVVVAKAGQTVTAGQTLLTLLPEDERLEAILYVPSRAIAFIQAEQMARIRYDAFPYQRFGVFSGQVTEVSQTVLLPDEVPDLQLSEPSYRIKVQLDQQQVEAYQKQLPLKAGMTLQADIVTEQRDLWQWLFDPILALRGHF